ncbi:MAG: hypothetical protein JNJ98_09450, partial [Gemmatimonadetes bacterium]|nr:hypothetical protein [Gemmatimonadota bacterium]
MTPPGLDVAMGALDGVPLTALGNAALLNRVDTKYIVPASVVPALIAACAPTYR